MTSTYDSDLASEKDWVREVGLETSSTEDFIPQRNFQNRAMVGILVRTLDETLELPTDLSGYAGKLSVSLLAPPKLPFPTE